MKMPFEVPANTHCDIFKKFYMKYIKTSVEGRTNYPDVPPAGLCPLPKVS